MASIGFSGAGHSLARIILVAAALGAAAPASAQWLGPLGDAPIPPGGIVRSLMNRGFVEIGRPRLNGDVYVVEGMNARGTRLRLVIDAYDGSLVSRTRLDAPLVPPAEVGRGGRVARPDPFRDSFATPFEDETFAPPQREAYRTDPAPRQPSAAATPQRKAPKAAAPQAVPPAPAVPVEAAKPETAKAEPPKAEPAKAEPAPVPAAVPPAPAKPPEAPAPAAAKPAEPPAAQEPPQRSVRVIEGVTPVVPQPAETAKPPEEKKPEITPPATLE